MNEVSLDKKIELLLYYKNGLLTVSEYLELISENRIIHSNYNTSEDIFSIETDTGGFFKFKVKRLERE